MKPYIMDAGYNNVAALPVLSRVRRGPPECADGDHFYRVEDVHALLERVLPHVYALIVEDVDTVRGITNEIRALLGKERS